MWYVHGVKCVAKIQLGRGQECWCGGRRRAADTFPWLGGRWNTNLEEGKH